LSEDTNRLLLRLLNSIDFPTSNVLIVIGNENPDIPKRVEAMAKTHVTSLVENLIVVKLSHNPGC